MGEGIEGLVKITLEENNIKVGYDPKNGEYTPWYKVPFKVDFTKKVSVSRVNILSRRIRIPESGYYSTIEHLTGGLLHETGHVDIWPVEMTLLSYAVIQLPSQFEEPIVGTIVTAALTLGYLLVLGELVVEGYNCLKHGKDKYLNLRFGKNNNQKS